MAEDLLKERVLLANRIANTIKIKKRIPSTTADYYKVY
jgi:MAP/microtubule affinity-regulating kinase